MEKSRKSFEEKIGKIAEQFNEVELYKRVTTVKTKEQIKGEQYRVGVNVQQKGDKLEITFTFAKEFLKRFFDKKDGEVNV